MELETTALGRVIRVTAVRCGADHSLTVCGGETPHVGAVTVACGGSICGKWVAPGHRDDVVSDRFARTISQKTGGTVSAACGIHYDALPPEQLPQILAACDALLAELERNLT